MMDTLTLLTAGAILCAYLAGAMGPRLWVGRRRGRNASWSSGRPTSSSPINKVKDARITDAAEQLRIVMTASFEQRRIMSPAEARVFMQVEKAVKALDLPWRVMAQVCLGEIIRGSDARAHAAINSKRVDILVISSRGEPVAAIEFQGSGHHLGSAAARDAVKKEALRRAGVAYLEVLPSHDADYLSREIARLGGAEAKAA